MKRLMGWLLCFAAMIASGLTHPVVVAQDTILSVPSRFAAPRPSILWYDDLDSGWRESKRTGRPMVIFITSARCRYCDAMKAATWRDVGINQRVGSEFVAVRLSPERNAKELSRIKVDVYPTTLVALPQGKVIDHRKGYQPPDLMHGLLNRVVGR